jgi:hypothetical protein
MLGCHPSRLTACGPFGGLHFYPFAATLRCSRRRFIAFLVAFDIAVKSRSIYVLIRPRSRGGQVLEQDNWHRLISPGNHFLSPSAGSTSA